MWSTGQNSYFFGKMVGGCSCGLARLSDALLSVEPVGAADGCTGGLASRFGLMELRRLTGERATEAAAEDEADCCSGGAGCGLTFAGGDAAAVLFAMVCERGDGGGCAGSFCEEDRRRPEMDSESIEA